MSKPRTTDAANVFLSSPSPNSYGIDTPTPNILLPPEIPRSVWLCGGVARPHHQVALGTAGKINANNDATATAVHEWLRLGGRHVDTATMYYNLEGVKRGILASNIPRSEIYITLKIHMEAMGLNKTLTAFDIAAKELGVDYVDLLLIHWPGLSARSAS